jgi:hypothetical protein
MRRFVIVVAVFACKSDKPSAPVVGSYQELVASSQRGSATESRTELECAARMPIPPRPEPTAGAPVSQQEAVKRQAQLAAMTGDRLVREADAGELISTVLTRLTRADASTRLSTAEQDVLHASTYEGEVHNGGHHQFFLNSSGDVALEVRDALARIGRIDAVTLIDCAHTAFPDNKPARDRDQRNEQLARWGDKQFVIFERLDEALYASTSWTPTLDRYIRAYITEMPIAGTPIR